MKNLIFALLVLLNIGLITYIFLDRYPPNFSESNATRSEKTSQEAFIDYPFPEDIRFAGEAVPLDQGLVRERLDKALAKLVFRHGNTSLNFKRAARWFPRLEKILKENGIPDDFKYLALVESNLSNVISRVGATGFWQLMPLTAQEYGLEVNEEVDERYHPLKSAQVASQYLKDAQGRFQTWALAAASYNMGMNGLEKRIKAQKAKSYYDLYLNPETGNYVYHIIATKCIFENPEAYGYGNFKDKAWPEAKLKTLEIREDIPDLAQFAQSQGFSYFILKSYNPWLRKNTLSIKKNGPKTYSIQVPE